MAKAIDIEEVVDSVVARALPVLCKEKQWYVASEDGDWCSHPKKFACKFRDYSSLKRVRCYSEGDNFVEYCMAACRVREED